MLKFLPTHVFNAINQFNKTVSLELAYVSCGRAMQEAKCPRSPLEGICGHVCNSYFPFLFSTSISVAFQAADPCQTVSIHWYLISGVLQ